MPGGAAGIEGRVSRSPLPVTMRMESAGVGDLLRRVAPGRPYFGSNGLVVLLKVPHERSLGLTFSSFMKLNASD